MLIIIYEVVKMAGKKSPGMPKRLINLRVPYEVYYRYKAAADRAGVPLANYLVASLQVYFDQQTAVQTLLQVVEAYKAQQSQGESSSADAR